MKTRILGCSCSVHGRRKGSWIGEVNKRNGGGNSIMCVYKCGDTCYAPRAIVTLKRRSKKGRPSCQESIAASLCATQLNQPSAIATHFHCFKLTLVSSCLPDPMALAKIPSGGRPTVHLLTNSKSCYRC